MRIASQSVATLCVIALAICMFRHAPIVLADDAPTSPDHVPQNMDDLQKLAAPIALYPDALLAQVLAATTYPDDVIAAVQWEDAGNTAQDIDSRPWDSSVKGIGRYPAVLHYLASNAEWMNDLGDAFINQRTDVMTAVQNLRHQAIAAGTLVSSPQQTVVNEDGFVQIIPTNPDVLYAPIYDPNIAYSPPAYTVGQAYPSCITYGPPITVGVWLDFDLDWHDHGIYHGDWGHDRPWWHRTDGEHGGPAPRYLDIRPGAYRPGQFKDRSGRPINAPSDAWSRDSRKPAPRPANRGVPGPVAGRPERGYPTVAPVRGAPQNTTPRGSEVSRDSNRGAQSRQGAVAPARAPTAAPVRSEPVRSEPTRAEPVHSEPRQPAPPAEARSSAPVRGGAMGGYESGASAAGNASRGAASRGAASSGGASRGGGGRR